MGSPGRAARVRGRRVRVARLRGPGRARGLLVALELGGAAGDEVLAGAAAFGGDRRGDGGQGGRAPAEVPLGGERGPGLGEVGLAQQVCSQDSLSTAGRWRAQQSESWPRGTCCLCRRPSARSSSSSSRGCSTGSILYRSSSQARRTRGPYRAAARLRHLHPRRPAAELGLIEGISEGLARAGRFVGGALADDPTRRRAGRGRRLHHHRGCCPR